MSEKQKQEEFNKQIKTELQGLCTAHNITSLQKHYLYNTLQFYKAQYSTVAKQNEIVVGNIGDEGEKIKELIESLKEKETEINELKKRVAMNEERRGTCEITEEMKIKIDELLEQKKLDVESAIEKENEKIKSVENVIEKENREEEDYYTEMKHYKEIYEKMVSDRNEFMGQIEVFKELQGKLIKEKKSYNEQLVEDFEEERVFLKRENFNLIKEINYLRGVLKILESRNKEAEIANESLFKKKCKIEKITDSSFFTEIENLAVAYDSLGLEIVEVKKEKTEIESKLRDLEVDSLRKDGLIKSLEESVAFLKAQKPTNVSLESKIENYCNLVLAYEDRKRSADHHKTKYIELSKDLVALKNQKIIAEQKYLNGKKTVDECIKKMALLSAQLKSANEDVKNLKHVLNCFFEGKVCDSIGEVEKYRKILKCTACDRRFKDAVISTCMHVFCFECLEMRIKLRNRTCPFCGEGFSSADIKRIYL